MSDRVSMCVFTRVFVCVCLIENDDIVLMYIVCVYFTC